MEEKTPKTKKKAWKMEYEFLRREKVKLEERINYLEEEIKNLNSSEHQTNKKSQTHIPATDEEQEVANDDETQGQKSALNSKSKSEGKKNNIVYPKTSFSESKPSDLDLVEEEEEEEEENSDEETTITTGSCPDCEVEVVKGICPQCEYNFND